MITCEQFIYTISPVKDKSTYQVTAKSSDVSNSDIEELLPYVFPTNVDLTEFKESRSLLILNDGKIAYCRVHNIGIGFDGRDDTLYCHVILTDSEDFKKINYDSRILNEYYFEDPSKSGNLDKIIVEPKHIPINFDLLNDYTSILPDIFSSLFEKQKIALVTKNNTGLIQEVLATVPSSLRYVSFSTFLDDPQKQSKYQFLTIKKHFKRDLQDQFRIINLKQSNTEHHPKKLHNAFDESVEYLTNIVRFKDHEKLFQINNNFERIVNEHLKNKLILVTNCSKFSYASDDNLKQNYADRILEIIRDFDSETRKEYFDKVKNYSKQYELLENKIQNVGDPSMTLIEAFWLLPGKIMLDLFASFLPTNKKNEKKDD